MQCGPSPRTWGERGGHPGRALDRRTIPTHVGRTSLADCRAPSPADHPHARGENRPRSPPQSITAGPSPRTWGERLRGRKSLALSRTIPTHVGRTRSRSIRAP